MAEGHQRTGRLIVGAVGVILGAFALGMLALAVALLQAGVRFGNWSPGMLVGIGVLAALAAFCGVLAFRLISGKGAREGGGILSPTAFRALGVVFVLLGA